MAGQRKRLSQTTSKAKVRRLQKSSENDLVKFPMNLASATVEMLGGALTGIRQVVTGQRTAAVALARNQRRIRKKLQGDIQ